MTLKELEAYEALAYRTGLLGPALVHAWTEHRAGQTVEPLYRPDPTRSRLRAFFMWAYERKFDVNDAATPSFETWMGDAVELFGMKLKASYFGLRLGSPLLRRRIMT